MPSVDTLGLSKKLQRLLDEHESLSRRMAEIQGEAQQIFSCLDNEFSPIPPRKTAPVRPRPLDDRISISVGRSIALARRQGWDREKATAVAVEKAVEIAKRHGLAELSPEVLKRIDRKVSRRLQAAA